MCAEVFIVVIPKQLENIICESSRVQFEGNPSLAMTMKKILRWGSPENPMKSAYLVAQGYANFCKMVSIVIIGVPRLILNIGVCLIAILTNFWTFAYPSATTLSD